MSTSRVSLQERLGLDVLVHGEPERNDMVQYFAEQVQLLDCAEFCCYLDEVRAARISHHRTKQVSTL